MRTTTRIGAAAMILLLNACASTRSFHNARSTVELDRPAILELNEAFKSRDEDKVVEIPGLGEATCRELSCWVKVKGKVDVLDEGKPAGEKPIEGTLTFDPATTRRLLELIDEARTYHREPGLRGETGTTSCTAKRCRLEFRFDDDSREVHSAATSRFVPGAERLPASEEERKGPAIP